MNINCYGWSDGKMALFLKSFVSSVMLLLMISSSAIGWPTIATEENLRDAVLEKDIDRLTNVELELMDLNKDGVLDVADLIYYLKTEEKEVPVITFDVRQSEAFEGEGDIEVTMTFSMSYEGQIKYRQNGDEKIMTVSGTQGFLVVANPDDDERSATAETIDLEILYDSELDYVPGVESLHSVVIHENDCLWNGTIHNDVYTNVSDDLMDTSLNIHFQLEIIQNNGSVTASVYTDGNGIIPLNNGKATWPMGNVSFSEKGFHAEVLNIPSENDNFNAAFLRNLTLDAEFDDQSMKSHERTVISGNVTETLQSSKYPFLNRSTTGEFYLFKIDPTVN